MLDVYYSRALRDATHSWSRQRSTDNLTLQELRGDRQPSQHEAAKPQDKVNPVPGTPESGNVQPQLAQFGHLGTRLNLYA